VSVKYASKFEKRKSSIISYTVISRLQSGAKKYLFRWLKYWLLGFETHSRSGCILLFRVCVVLCMYMNCELLIPDQGVLPTIYTIFKFIINTGINPLHKWMNSFILCLCCPVYVHALRMADPRPRSPTNYLQHLQSHN
jgi:hypothetical protein